MERIAYITADRGIPVFGAKGASIHVREMVKAMTDIGYEVEVFAARVGDHSQPLPAIVNKIRAGGGLSVVANELEGEDRVNARERYATMLSDAVVENLARIHRQRPFTQIYERYGLFSTAGVDAARRLGIPCCLEVNSPLVLEQQRYRQLANVEVAEDVEHRAFTGADAICCVSDEVADYVISRGAPRGKVRVVPNAVDQARFRPDVPAKTLPVPGDRTIVGFSGSLKPWHGLDLLLPAFARLLQNGNHVHLLLIGDGPLRQWIEGFAEGAGVSEHVTITGWVDHEELPAWLTAVDIAVAPYPDADDFYFSPLKLAEYMAAGRCIVASDIGQISQLIRDDHNGRLVRPGDLHALVHMIERMRALPMERQRLGRIAREAACDHTWRDVAARVTEMTREAANRSRQASC
jgi:glycosyltransferase involved in cell wall biosynthesis